MGRYGEIWGAPVAVDGVVEHVAVDRAERVAVPD